jgi:hypothetical protein
MKRRVRPDNAAKFSLFPFLAVLLCVMGALIVLLIVIAQRTHDRATQQVVATEDAEKLREAREELAWRLDVVRKSRDDTAAQLAQQRADLSHVEDHARRLREQYHALQQAARDMEDSLNAPSAASREIDDQLAAIRMRMDEVKELLNAKKLTPQAAAGYAIIPYEGPNGTQRRPMYIECCEDGIILQPEGVVLTASDFEGPLGPGNPLAASMRAAREYLYKRRAAGGDPGEPYPLLLIRPDGIEAYYVAREALTSWGSEFGYEFVDQDWKLEYPEPDPTLVALVRAAAEDARQRQALLARIAPNAFDGDEPGEGGAMYRASPTTGGVVRDGGGRRGGRRSGSGSRGTASRGEGKSEPRGGGGGFGGPDEDGKGLNGYAGLEDAGDGEPRTRGGFKQSGGDKPSGSNAPGVAGQEGEPSDGSPEQQMAGRNSKNKPGEKGEPLKPGQYVPKPTESMASKRGQNWGLKEAGPSAVPISRKIRVRCEPTQLVVVTTERGAKTEQAIPLGARTQDAVEELVSRVWDQMDDWGMAGNNMYWKPQLQFEVTQETRPRYEEIKTLLEGSGLDVAERGATGTARKASAPK